MSLRDVFNDVVILLLQLFIWMMVQDQFVGQNVRMESILIRMQFEILVRVVHEIHKRQIWIMFIQMKTPESLILWAVLVIVALVIHSVMDQKMSHVHVSLLS